ncbi:MAG TPA: FGGY-family carbohydrate kinase, partial [Bacillaceae bacterium]
MDAKAGNITIIGGGAKSRSWCQILADISQRDVRVPENSEFLPSLGAAASAFRYLGWTNDYADFVSRFIMNRQAEWFSPNKEHEALYNEAYKRFVRLYPSLKQVYSAQ